VQVRDELIDLRGHDGENHGRGVVDRGEGVDRPSRNNQEVAASEASTFAADLDVEHAVDDAEALIRSVVDVPRRLIPG
jgi:hypothetical protein